MILKNKIFNYQHLIMDIAVIGKLNVLKNKIGILIDQKVKKKFDKVPLVNLV